jgi:hypothetical protein
MSASPFLNPRCELFPFVCPLLPNHLLFCVFGEIGQSAADFAPHHCNCPVCVAPLAGRRRENRTTTTPVPTFNKLMGGEDREGRG